MQIQTLTPTKKIIKVHKTRKNLQLVNTNSAPLGVVGLIFRHAYERPCALCIQIQPQVQSQLPVYLIPTWMSHTSQWLSYVIRQSTMVKKVSHSVWPVPLRVFHNCYHKDSIVDTKVRSDKHCYLTVMFGLVGQNLSTRETFYLTSHPGNLSIDKLIVPLFREDNEKCIWFIPCILLHTFILLIPYPSCLF